MRASTVAAAFIVVTAGLSLAAIAQRDNLARLPTTVRAAAESMPSRTPTATLSAPSDPRLAEALSTSNVYARPERTAAVVSVLPGGQRATVTGRNQAADWLYIAASSAGGLNGWTPAATFRIDAAVLAGLPVVTAPPLTTSTPAANASTTDGASPDPSLTEALLLSNGQLEVRVRNAGAVQPLIDATLTLSISKLGGEAIGVFRIGPASIPPGEVALVVPPLAITEVGRYRLELTVGAEVPDADKANNVLEVTLTPRPG